MSRALWTASAATNVVSGARSRSRVSGLRLRFYLSSMRLRSSESSLLLCHPLRKLTRIVCSPTVNPTLLSRQEIVALFNTLHRFSESLHAVEQFRQIYAERQAAEGVSDQTTPRVVRHDSFNRLMSLFPVPLADFLDPQRNPSRSASPSRRRGSAAQPYTSTTKRFWLALRQSASARWRTLKARCSSGFVACLQAWLGREWAARIATLTGGDATAVVGAAGARGDSPPSAPSVVPKPQAFGLKAEL